MAGKVSDEDMFRLEKRIKKAEAIIACMTEEERTVPDLLARQVSTNTNMSKGFLLSIAPLCPTYVRISYGAISGMYLLLKCKLSAIFSLFFSLILQGGKKELMREAQLRREDLGKRADTDVREVRTSLKLFSYVHCHHSYNLLSHFV